MDDDEWRRLRIEEEAAAWDAMSKARGAWMAADQALFEAEQVWRDSLDRVRVSEKRDG